MLKRQLAPHSFKRDPLVRQLAEEIIVGQSTEIAAMRQRLVRLRAG